MAGQRIGELNGRWALMLKAGLALMPAVFTLIVGLQIHIVNKIHTLEVWVGATDANRFTMTDWVREREKLIEQLPPRWVQDELKNLREGVARLEEQIKRQGRNG